MVAAGRGRIAALKLGSMLAGAESGGRITKMKASQKRVKEAIAFLKDYLNTYEDQTGYLDYTDDTIINDVLYGLGVALDKRAYSYAKGYRLFAARLREHLKELV
jgi:hypothetical protein